MCKLRRIGTKVCGVVAHTTVNSIKLGAASDHVLNPGSWSKTSRNDEIPEMAQGIAETRRRALAAVRSQASAVGASGLVISTLKHEIEHRYYSLGRGKHHYFYVTFHVVGTAINGRARQPHPAPLPNSTISLNLAG